jgi:hypothetical protein
MFVFRWKASESPNDPKLSDGGGWRDGCAGEGGGAASVTAGAVRCSAWLGDWSFLILSAVVMASSLSSVVLPAVPNSAHKQHR